MGPVIGRGAVWVKEDLAAGAYSDPYLCNGYDIQIMIISHKGSGDLKLEVEVDKDGSGNWIPHVGFKIDASESKFIDLKEAGVAGAWLRLKAVEEGKQVTAQFHYRMKEERGQYGSSAFADLAADFETVASNGNKSEIEIKGGLLHVRGDNLRTLRFVPDDFSKENPVVYDLNEKLELTKVEDFAGGDFVSKKCAYPQGVISVEEASVLYVDEKGNRWRLPKNDVKFDEWMKQGLYRVCREVATERDLLNVHGTFFELPAENAGGFSKIRAVSTHNKFIHDYATYRGMLVMSGMTVPYKLDVDGTLKSDDDKQRLKVCALDDIWKMGKPQGIGGPWKNSQVKKDEPSDPYLLTGYDKKSLRLSHDSTEPVNFTIEIDITGEGLWVTHSKVKVEPATPLALSLENTFAGYWVRIKSSSDTSASALFKYE